MSTRRTAHRRLTSDQQRGFDRLRDELRESGIQSLLAFANQTDRPWRDKWSAFPRIDGDGFSEAGADELQGTVRAWLKDLIDGRLSLTMAVVTTHYTLHAGTLTWDGPQHDLGEYVLWLLCEALRSGQARQIHVCRWSVCDRPYFHGKGQYCSPACQNRDWRRREDPTARRARNRADQARLRRGLFGARQHAIKAQSRK
jgi:hypothetical protein